MEPGSHPDPIREAASHNAQRAAQLMSVAIAAAQGYIMYRSRRAAMRAAADEQEAQSLREQERQAVQQARAGWAPALDQRWLGQADLLQAARAWGAAAPYAEADATAATAMRRSEQRLRVLHPYAMARYDRIRGDGMAPADAMIETAPLFARHPHAHERPPAPDRAAIGLATPGSNENQPAADSRTADRHPAVPAGRDGPGRAEAGSQPARAAVLTTRPGTGRAPSTAAALAARSFPYTIHQTLRSTARAQGVTSAPRPRSATEQAPRRGPTR